MPQLLLDIFWIQDGITTVYGGDDLAALTFRIWA